MFENFVNRLNNKKKVIIPSILVLVLIIGGAIYGVNHNKPIEKKPTKKAVHKVKEDKSAETSKESAASESATGSSEASKPVENSKPSKAEKKAEKNSSAKSGSVTTSSGSSSSSSNAQASKPKEPIYATRTVQRAVQVYDPMKESYIQCACGCRNPSHEHIVAHMERGEPSNTKRVYVGGYVTKYETVTERYIIGYK